MADIVLINPRFEISYWGLEHAMPFLGVKAVMPVANLALLAALTPAGNSITLVDENIEPIDFARCARADIVGLTGMNVQRRRMKEIIHELKRHGVFTVVGGPWVTVQEDDIAGLVDVIFIGEAEQTWPRFLGEWAEGRHGKRYEQAERTDMATVPVPRLDLLRMKDYAFGSVQFSRGCPFECEFCDIIVTFGRRPRIKTSAQVLAELDALVAAGQRFAFIVDDNLIGNKRAIKPLLRDVVAWQEAHGYPLMFATEASIDLAEDAELMKLMMEINISSVFVGIETTNEASLRETKKLQNLRARGGSMLDKVHRIQEAGMEVWSGIIVGFDNDDASIFSAQSRFVREARIVSAMVNMLVAIPRTPLHKRLANEGRLTLLEDEEHRGPHALPAPSPAALVQMQRAAPRRSGRNLRVADARDTRCGIAPPVPPAPDAARLASACSPDDPDLCRQMRDALPRTPDGPKAARAAAGFDPPRRLSPGRTLWLTRSSTDRPSALMCGARGSPWRKKV